ncbi:MAG TPA: HAMP domain-containing sensor histidine kinase [Vicinamibacterales bacterium]
MTPATTRKSLIFIALGACLVALAVALNVSWIVINWRAGLLLVLGIIFFLVIITGLVLNTIFLVREIRRNEQHDAFINAVTHELKTPVASIRLYLETLQRRELDEARRQEFYGIMLADSDRLLHLIEQVLRAGRTRQRLRHRSPIDLRDIVREAVELARVRHHLADDAVRYTEHVRDAGATTVLGDADELKAAVWNLLDNAVKYSNGSVRVEVDLLPVDARRVAVRVRDYGIGISRAELTRIFRRFYRIPEAVAMRVKGSGLGLFIVSTIARRHGGRVSAESEGAGKGSTFTLQLPVAPTS